MPSGDPAGHAAHAPAVSPDLVAASPAAVAVGVGSMFASVAVTCFLPHPNLLQEYAILTLIASGATIALAGIVVSARWHSRLLSLSGPAVIFLFVMLVGAAAFNREHFGTVAAPVTGTAAGAK